MVKFLVQRGIGPTQTARSPNGRVQNKMVLMQQSLCAWSGYIYIEFVFSYGIAHGIVANTRTFLYSAIRGRSIK